MLDLSIDRDLDARLDQVRRLGREHLRPLGIEADRRREPVPPDHRFFAPFRDRERPHWAAFAMTEPGAGSDVAAIQTTAVRAGDAWVLNGAKTFISNSMRADWIVVWATVDRSAGRAGHRAFIVERGTPEIGRASCRARGEGG